MGILKRRLQNLLTAVKLVPLTVTSIIIDPNGNPVTKAEDVEKFINRLQNMVLAAAGAIAMAMVIYGAIILGTAGGNEEKIGKGKKILTFAVGGLILILLAGTMTSIFVRFLGGGVN